ncbi:flagellar motor protein MotB [Sphingomonas sp. RS6]
MTFDDDEDRPARPIWLVTLADLALLLVGFFAFLKASERDPRALAQQLRAGFVAAADAAMPVELAVAGGFAGGSAQPGDLAAAIEWARSAARDPRTTLVVTGESDSSAGDVDRATTSAELLAADRARAVAAALLRAGVVTPDRIRLNTGRGARRVVLTLGYDGGRQGVAARQPAVAAPLIHGDP